MEPATKNDLKELLKEFKEEWKTSRSVTAAFGNRKPALEQATTPAASRLLSTDAPASPTTIVDVVPVLAASDASAKPLDIDATGVVPPTPTTCSTECPSRAATASTSVFTLGRTPTSVTTTIDVTPVLTASVVTNDFTTPSRLLQAAAPALIDELKVLRPLPWPSFKCSQAWTLLQLEEFRSLLMIASASTTGQQSVGERSITPMSTSRWLLQVPSSKLTQVDFSGFNCSMFLPVGRVQNVLIAIVELKHSPYFLVDHADGHEVRPKSCPLFDFSHEGVHLKHTGPLPQVTYVMEQFSGDLNSPRESGRYLQSVQRKPCPSEKVVCCIHMVLRALSVPSQQIMQLMESVKLSAAKWRLSVSTELQGYDIPGADHELRPKPRPLFEFSQETIQLKPPWPSFLCKCRAVHLWSELPNVVHEQVRELASCFCREKLWGTSDLVYKRQEHWNFYGHHLLEYDAHVCTIPRPDKLKGTMQIMNMSVQWNFFRQAEFQGSGCFAQECGSEHYGTQRQSWRPLDQATSNAKQLGQECYSQTAMQETLCLGTFPTHADYLIYMDFINIALMGSESIHSKQFKYKGLLSYSCYVLQPWEGTEYLVHCNASYEFYLEKVALVRKLDRSGSNISVISVIASLVHIRNTCSLGDILVLTWRSQRLSLEQLQGETLARDILVLTWLGSSTSYGLCVCFPDNKYMLVVQVLAHSSGEYIGSVHKWGVQTNAVKSKEFECNISLCLSIHLVGSLLILIELEQCTGTSSYGIKPGLHPLCASTCRALILLLFEWPLPACREFFAGAISISIAITCAAKLCSAGDIIFSFSVPFKSSSNCEQPQNLVNSAATTLTPTVHIQSPYSAGTMCLGFLHDILHSFRNHIAGNNIDKGSNILVTQRRVFRLLTHVSSELDGTTNNFQWLAELDLGMSWDPGGWCDTAPVSFLNQTHVGRGCCFDHAYYYFDEVPVSNNYDLDTSLEQVSIGYDYYVHDVCFFDLVQDHLNHGHYHDNYHGDSDMIKDLQSPWDPGEFFRQRLGDKPTFKKGGVLATSPNRYVYMGLSFGSAHGPGLPACL